MAHFFTLTNQNDTTDELYVGNLLPDGGSHREQYIAVQTKSLGNATRNRCNLEMCIPVVGGGDEWGTVHANIDKGEIAFDRVVTGAKIRVRKTTNNTDLLEVRISGK